MKPPKTKQEYISEGLDAAAIRDLDLIEDAAFARGKNQGISIGRAFTEKIGPATDLVPSTPGGVGNPPATPDSAPAGGRPAPPATTLEQVLAESERQEEAAQKFAQSLTAPQVEAADDPVAIGLEARRLRDQRPSLGVAEAINLVRERRGLAARHL